MRQHDDLSDRVRFTVINSLLNSKQYSMVHEILQSHMDDEGSYPGRASIGALIGFGIV